MKRLLSVIYPVSTTFSSKYSGALKIMYHKGKKQLNSKNANYSYGNLQRILKFGLEKIDIIKVNSVLILGMGGGSVIKTLRNDFNYNKPITAVEIDPVIITIADTEFGIKENESLTIHCTDAYNFIQTHSEVFDLIVVDLYIDLNIPDKFLSLEFWNALLNSKSSKGQIIFNASVGSSTSTLKLEEIISFLHSKVYKVSVYENVNTTNTIIVTSSL